jgi:hypothetical protein
VASSRVDRDWIFVCHSRRDDEGRLFLHDLLSLAHSQFRPDFYSLDHPVAPHAEPVRDRIRRASALFVLLSAHMLKIPHTRSWVGYEVGIAAELNLPVVVFEPKDSHVDLPVPGATHYLQRPASAAGLLGGAWKVVVETACHLEPTERMEFTEKWSDNILAFLYNASTGDLDSTGAFHRATCRYTDCRSRFYVPEELYQSESFPCPCCRTEVQSFRVGLMELSDKLAERANAQKKN